MSETITNDTLRGDYADPVGRLLTIGDAHSFGGVAWPDYPEQYGLRHDHVPELLRMACDMALHNDESDGPIVWAPVHAWRALAQLRAVETIAPLLEFMKIDIGDHVVAQEFPTLFGMMGPAAIAPIAAFLEDQNIEWMPASLATTALVQIVERHAECRDECIGILTRRLQGAANINPEANGFAIGNLMDLQAVEAIDTIREAFRLDVVDETIAGDLEDVEIAFGLREQRSRPRPRFTFPPRKIAPRESPSITTARYEPSEFEPEPRPAKIGRNEPCPCGSGKKYKKCCLP
jgi:hypothetical protein